MKIMLYGPDEVHRMEIYLERVPLKGELLTVSGLNDLMLTYRVVDVETFIGSVPLLVLHLTYKDDQ